MKDIRLRDLGERKILRDIVFNYLDTNENELGIDEDAVAIKLDDEYLVVNVDTFVESTDAPPRMTRYQMGYRVVIMTISDLISKGALPKFILISISAPKDLKKEDLRELLSGIKDACNKFEASYLGGDLGASEDLVLTGVGFGTTRKLIHRNTALPGDTVWVTGPFGISGAALHYLIHGGKGNRNLVRQILRNYFFSRLSLNEGKAIQEIATAAMDSSDGLAITLNTLAEQSKVMIELNRLPVSKLAVEYADSNNINLIDLVFFSGEEFEIIFTVRDLSDSKVMAIFKKNNARPPIKIGVVKEGRGVFYQGKKIPYKGWEHFGA